jgi:ubiquinone/menaquinone biosynthesis C-methylase UbiE
MAESIPLPDNTIDLIASNNGINNVSDLDKVLSECARIAKPDAQFILTMNLNRSMFEFYDQLEQVLKELSLQSTIDQMHAHIYRKRRPLQEIVERLEQHGFEIRDVKQDQFHYRFTDATAMFEHAFVQLAFLPTWMSILPPERADEILSIVEARLNETARGEQGMMLTIPFVVMDARRVKS